MESPSPLYPFRDMVERIQTTASSSSSSSNSNSASGTTTTTINNNNNNNTITKASASRSLSKKTSSRDLNREPIASPTGARPKLSRSATLAAHPLPKHRQTLPPPPRYTPNPTPTIATPTTATNTTTTIKNNHAPARTGHARGGPALTLRIDSTLGSGSMSRSGGGGGGSGSGSASGGENNYHALRSAPARSVRRLPAVPGVGGRRSPFARGAPTPLESAATVVVPPPTPFTPFTAPVGASPFGRREGRRSVRPLPCLPSLVTPPPVPPLPQEREESEEEGESLNTVTPTASTSRSGSITPTTKIKPTTTTIGTTAAAAPGHTRSKSVRKPLPVPVCKPKVEEGDEAFVVSQLVVATASAAVLESEVQQSTPPVPEVEVPVQQSNATDEPVSQEVVLEHQRDRESWTPELDADTDAVPGVYGNWDEEEEGMDLDDLEEGVIQLGNRIVLRKISNVSLDSDFTSEEEEEEELKPLPPLKEKDTKKLQGDSTNSGEDEYIDYSWVLSENRMLYKQCNGQAGVVSKWVLERKGKRYTEQDYENIIQALRTL